VWRQIVRRAALRHIQSINKGIVSDILTDEYLDPVPFDRYPVG
jgi:hypothetical protein